jgi:hypothetical protein
MLVVVYLPIRPQDTEGVCGLNRVALLGQVFSALLQFWASSIGFMCWDDAATLALCRGLALAPWSSSHVTHQARGSCPLTGPWGAAVNKPIDGENDSKAERERNNPCNKTYSQNFDLSHV